MSESKIEEIALEEKTAPAEINGTNDAAANGANGNGDATQVLSSISGLAFTFSLNHAHGSTRANRY